MLPPKQAMLPEWSVVAEQRLAGADLLEVDADQLSKLEHGNLLFAE